MPAQLSDGLWNLVETCNLLPLMPAQTTAVIYQSSELVETYSSLHMCDGEQHVSAYKFLPGLINWQKTAAVC